MPKIINKYKELTYAHVPEHVWLRAGHVKLLLCDVDGVLSNGLIYMGNNGEELKSFHTHDGYGLRTLLQVGIKVGVITGRSSQIVTNRMQNLGIDLVYQGITDKQAVFNKILIDLKLKADEVAYIGDDLVDFKVMQQVGLAVIPSDGHRMLHMISHWQTERPGGYGAVRELCELILFAQDKFTLAHGVNI